MAVSWPGGRYCSEDVVFGHRRVAFSEHIRDCSIVRYVSGTVMLVREGWECWVLQKRNTTLKQCG